MKKKTPDIYDRDKDTARVRKHAERFTVALSLAYLVFMFILSNLKGVPFIATLSYPAVIVIGLFLYLNKRIPRKVYEYWFAFSAAALCIIYAIFTSSITVPMLIYLTTLCMTSMFRDERLIFIDMIWGMVLSVICFFIQYKSPEEIENVYDILEFLVVPSCVYAAYFTLTNLVKRDKQLFLFSQQKNLNNLNLLEIVEAKRAEAETAAKVKTEFLANTSHEIRTPMNSIMGMTELTLREEVSPQVRSYLGNIRDAGTNLLNIINDILDFSKIESGKTELSSSDYNILSVMNDVCNITSIRMNNDAVQLITCINPDVPSVLTGDERRIKQIILNLASNAIKYTRHGSITISVSVKPDEENEGVILCCDVKDTGMGIREHDIKRLFNAFERADPKRNRNIEGTGLGLAICKSLTEMMGGTIKVRSIYGAGSVFSIEIPQGVKDYTPCINLKNTEKYRVLLCISDKEQNNAVSAELSSLGINFFSIQDLSTVSLNKIKTFSNILIDYEKYISNKRILSMVDVPMAVITDPGVRLSFVDPEIKRIYRPVTIISLLSLLGADDALSESRKNTQIKYFFAPKANILVVDDNATNLLVAKRLISLYRVNTDTAESGIQALKMVQKKDYDIVFMDHMMPELDGIETAQAIRSLGGKYAKLTIVALTANVVSGAAELFRESGMDDFLGKPIELNELNRVLARYIPEEKQIAQNGEPLSAEKKGSSPFIEKLKGIDGLDVETALNQCSGDEKFLSDILRSVATTISAKKLKEAFENKDLKSYTIYVHGIKGALRNVGMETLGSLAFDLEMAGKKGDTDYILSRHSEFIESFEAFAAKVIEITADMEIKNREKGDLSELKGHLSEIIDASENMDYSRASQIVKIIEKNTYGEKYDKNIGLLSEAIENFDFPEAADIAHSISGEEN